jgi:hypothetical protein
VKKLTKRPEVSQEIINIFSYLVDKQDKKGWEKYNKTIDDASDEDWDWVEMALEEAVDGMKYLVKENIRLRREIKTYQDIISREIDEKKPPDADLDD